MDRESLVKYLDYNPDTGLFTWKPRGIPSFDKVFSGEIAGTKRDINGYHRVDIRLLNKKYLGHNLAWLFMTGSFIEDGYEVDHINCDGWDNRWCNLRKATRKGNLSNRGNYRDGGLKGAYQRPNGKWQAIISHNGKAITIGTYSTQEEAHHAYCEKAKKLHGEFSRFN